MDMIQIINDPKIITGLAAYMLTMTWCAVQFFRG